MFGRSFHYLQIFPVLLLLFASQQQSLFSSFDLDLYSAYIISFSALIGLVALSFPTGVKTRRLVVLSSFLSLAFLMNYLIFKPSLAIICILLVLYASLRLTGAKHLKVSNLRVRKLHIFSSYLFLLVSYLTVEPINSGQMMICYLAFSYAASSCLYLSLSFLNNKFYRSISLAILISSSFLFGFNFLEALQLLAMILFFAASIFSIYVLVNRDSFRQLEKSYAHFFTKPEIIILSYFIVLAFVGALFLQSSFSQMLPFSNPHSFLDSFFTAMSAICVTGLSVFDISQDLTLMGQFILLCLIQLGGLGITSLSAWILLLLSSKRLNVGHEEAIYKLSASTQKINIRALVKRIFSYFVFMEFLGASLLSFSFYLQGENFLSAIWRGIFTAVSAFCNAGFALQSDSLISYQNHLPSLILVSFLIIAGGFAPLMVLDLPEKFRLKKFNLQDKLVLWSTASLLVVGFVFFLIVEWNHSLGDLGIASKFGNAWFQSVTARTAGFNSIDFTDMRELSQMFFLLLMFIGGNPGSTAGGVKTISIAVLFVAALGAIRESDEARAFDKRIPVATVFKALLIVSLGLIVHFVFFFALSVTQNIDSLSLLFETFSALGTVGLSLGATQELNEIGKILIILCMLAGRVGPISFVLLLVRRNNIKRWKVPSEEVSIT
jgi:trk system potassium uptake protein TrkH